MSKTSGLGLSICIPAYNAESRIGRTLEALHAAISDLPLAIRCEVILVDNGSRDGTVRVVSNFWSSVSPAYSAKVISEPRQGAAWARLRGYLMSAGEVIVFVDDDVSVAADAFAILVANTFKYPVAIGGGGRVIGELEEGVNWPSWMVDGLIVNLAIEPIAAITRSARNDASGQYLPVSAFVWYRRHALTRWSEFMMRPDAKPLGPAAQEMWRGDDQEMALLALKTGGGLLYEPSLVAYHRIATSRLNPDYFATLLYWNGRSSVRFRYRWSTGNWRHCLRMAAYTLLRHPRFMMDYLKFCLFHGVRREGHQLSAPVRTSTTLAMHRAFAFGEMDECIAKILSPKRF